MQKLSGRSKHLAAARPGVGRPLKAGGPRRWMTGLALVVALGAGLLGSCATAPASREDKAALVEEARARPRQMQTEDPTLGRCSRRATATPCFRMWARRPSSWVGPTAGE